MSCRAFFLFASAVIAVVAAGGPSPVAAGGGCRGVLSTSGSGSEVRMTGHGCFTPTVLYVDPGTTVTWVNETTDIHDVAGATLEWGSYEEIAAGERVRYAFDAPGTYPYYCFLHPGMIGAVVVGDGRPAGPGAVPVVQRMAGEPPSADDAQRSGAASAAGAAEEDDRFAGGMAALLVTLGAAAGGGLALAARAAWSRR